MSAIQQSNNSFSAHLALAAGLAVSITADTLEQLSGVVAKLQATAHSAPEKLEKAATPTPTAAPRGQTAAHAASDKVAGTKDRDAEAGNVPATTAAPAGAQPAASGSEGAAEAKAFTYDDVKARVLALAKVKRELAQETLAQFKTVAGDKVDHGNKLQLPDYAAFIAAADKALGAGK